MQYSKSARILKSIVYGVPLIVTMSVFVSSALANSQFSDEVAVEIDASQPLEIGRGVYRSLSSAATLQSDESRGIDRITLQNIHSIKDLDIFGSELMIKSELAKFRKDLKKIETQDRLGRYLAAHRARMNARATERGVALD